MPNLTLVPPRALQSSAEPTDSEARQLALDPTQSFIVEAPAGSGKTGLLIQRFLTLLAHPSVQDPSEVLAITFTRDATAELRDRILAQLRAAATDTTPSNSFDTLTRPIAQAALERDALLHWNLLADPRRLNVSTIDALSARIASALPVLSGAGESLTPAEDPAPLYAEAARRTLLHLGGPSQTLNEALRTLLLLRDNNLSNVQSLLAEMLPWRDQWTGLIPATPAELTDRYLDQTILPKLEKALDTAICRTLTQLCKVVPAAFLSRLCSLVAEMAHLDGHDSQPSPIAHCAGKILPPGATAADLTHWQALVEVLLTKQGDFRKPAGLQARYLKFLFNDRHKSELKRLLDEVRHDDNLCAALCAVRNLPPAQYPPEQWPIAKALFRTLAQCLLELQHVFTTQSFSDFTELSLLARHALRSEDPASPTLRLQHLLVDEMQDTSTAQYELIELLTRTWLATHPQPQTLFLVGDPKQSIYLFRQARVERFLQTFRTAHLGELPLTPLRLTANFRSTPAMIEAFNQDFPLVFPQSPQQPNTPGAIPYTLATIPHAVLPTPGKLALAAAAEPSPRQFHATVLSSRQDKSTQTQADANQIRTLIAHQLAQPLPPHRTDPWKIAVLVANRRHLTPIVEALRHSPPIPFRAIKIDPLKDRQEILDLLALTRALLHPADRTAWLAVLRTPWIGLSVADLLRIANPPNTSLPNPEKTAIFPLLDEFGDTLTPDGRTRLLAAYPIFRAALQLRGQTSLAALVERTWRASHAHLYATPEVLANTTQFFTLLHEIERPDGLIDLPTLTARLEALYAAASPIGQIDLMTIHNAKGLEWDLVLVPSLDRPGARDQNKALNWLELDPSEAEAAHALLAPIGRRGAASTETLLKWMKSIDSERKNAELKRLFYVAATRARRALHLFAATTRNNDGSLCAAKPSLLHAALPALEPHFTPAPLPPAVLNFPSSQHTGSAELLDLAATEHSLALETLNLYRIPLNTPLPPAPKPLPYGLPATPPAPNFDRPEGSFASRAFGNAVHALLEQLTLRLTTEIPATLLQELPSWTPAITAVLRASGLSPAAVLTRTPEVLQALTNTLTDPTGRWLLTPHPGAFAEQSLTLPDLTALRLDRTFLAGPEISSTGRTHRWIIDYKTATPGGRNLETFLLAEREKYTPQLHRYAEAIPPTHPLRLALYYPLIPRLILIN